MSSFLQRQSPATDARLHSGYLLHGFKLSLACGRKARFDYVHAKLLERFGDVKLLAEVHTAAGRLLSVAQGGIEYYYLVFIHIILLS